MITGLIGTISTVMASTITESEMYWLTRLTSLKAATVGVGTGIMIMFGTIGFVGLLAYCLEETERGLKWFKFSIPIFMLGGLITLSSIFIPNTKEMCAIKAIPVIVNNEQVQELPNKVVELANEWIDELKPSKNSE
jgi:fumarate reductase subunit C